MKQTHLLSATAAFALASTSTDAGIVAVTVIPNGGQTFTVQTANVGWSFTANSDMTVTDLGYFDLGGDGLVESHQVGIWADGGALLGSANVTTGNTLLSGFRYTPTSSFSLLSGQTYVIAGFTGFTDPYLTNPAGFNSFSTAPEVSYTGSRRATGAIFARPDTSGFTIGSFGPNFQFATSPIPEPGTAFFGLALCGVTAIRRRR